MSLEAVIASQTASSRPEDVTELVLDTCKAAKVTGLDKFSNLRLLTLNGCGLTTLEGFPTLPRLQRLELSDNNLSDGLEALQEAGLVHLKFLSLAGNKFGTLDALEPLASLPNLRDLDMFTCAVTELPDYRTKLFDMLPVLKYLDGFDAEDEEKPEDDPDDEDDEEDEEEEEDDDDDLLSSDGGVGFDESEADGEEGEYDDDGEEGVDESAGEEDDSELGEEEFGGEDDEDEGEDDAEDDVSEGGDAKRQRR